VEQELFTPAGPELVRTLVARGFEVFLDLKFTTFNTVAARRAAAGLGVWMLNVHASGGRRMMVAAQEALAGLPKPPFLIAVTVLTSMSAEDLCEVGVADAPADQVLRLARLAQTCELDGVVCSAQEVPCCAPTGRGFRQDAGIRPAEAGRRPAPRDGRRGAACQRDRSGDPAPDHGGGRSAGRPKRSNRNTNI
jgi:orotidine-5'-phosphate decarboxylase